MGRLRGRWRTGGRAARRRADGGGLAKGAFTGRLPGLAGLPSGTGEGGRPGRRERRGLVHKGWADGRALAGRRCGRYESSGRRSHTRAKERGGKSELAGGRWRQSSPGDADEA
ncbi:hypothetical protein NL676_019094 [Syzygium grande]|nr:hypothetical protein NL676_019094 [Syzygium grande]